MDIGALLILLAEAALALLILYYSGLLRKPAQVLVSAALVAAAFVLRGLCLSHETLDYVNFLSRWVQYFRENGGFAALSDSVGNYNVPYLYFLALFSYIGMDDLYLIKLLSILFDVILAWAALLLAGRFTRSRTKLLFCYFAVLFCPTVILNGAYWGQCDSIYAAFALLALYLALDGKPAWGMVCMAASFAVKLQAVFLMPIFVVLLLARRVKLWHFLLFPATYLALMLPAVFAGRPLWDTVTLYFNQMGSVGAGLNYNSSSIFAFAGDGINESLAGNLGLAAAFALMLAVFVWAGFRRARLGDWAILGCALLLAVGIPYFLPHMHDRYFFLADVLSICFAVAAPEYFILPLLCQFASLLGYHAYLRGRYLMSMRYGAAALALALVVLLLFVSAQLQSPRRGSAKN